MADIRRNEAGTTLVELLVVIVILAVLGTITTVSIVAGFGAQRDATNVADTLDGMRIATQRVRDNVRAANEICAGSTTTELRLWTDDEIRDGIVQPEELDIFELVPDGPDDHVFQRRTPTAGGGEVTQLIRDDIITGTLFDYDPLPENQGSQLRCHDSKVLSGSAVLRSVDVTFTVEHPDPAEDDLVTGTSVRLRNANLPDASENQRPTADVEVSCVTANSECTLDGTGSTDPEDTNVSFYSWEIKDPDGNIIATPSGPHPSGGEVVFDFSPWSPSGSDTFEVLLTVNDTDGRTDAASADATPVPEGGNVPPIADFTVSCLGRICDFTGSLSDDPDGTVTSYTWDFGGAGTTSTAAPHSPADPQHTYDASGPKTVTLLVTDDGGATGEVTETIQVGEDVIFVTGMTGTKSGSANDRTATFDVQLGRSAGGSPGEGIVITLDVVDKQGVNRTGSCDTDSTGGCEVELTGLSNGWFPMTASVKSVNDASGTFTYDPSQNDPDEVVVS